MCDSCSVFIGNSCRTVDPADVVVASVVDVYWQREKQQFVRSHAGLWFAEIKPQIFDRICRGDREKNNENPENCRGYPYYLDWNIHLSPFWHGLRNVLGSWWLVLAIVILRLLRLLQWLNYFFWRYNNELRLSWFGFLRLHFFLRFGLGFLWNRFWLNNHWLLRNDNFELGGVSYQSHSSDGYE